MLTEIIIFGTFLSTTGSWVGIWNLKMGLCLNKYSKFKPEWIYANLKIAYVNLKIKWGNLKLLPQKLKVINISVAWLNYNLNLIHFFYKCTYMNNFIKIINKILMIIFKLFINYYVLNVLSKKFHLYTIFIQI